MKQARAQLPTSADSATLLAFAAERRAAVRLAAAAPPRPPTSLRGWLYKM